MRPDSVVVQPPTLNDPTGICKVNKPVLVETLVSEPAVEAFYKGVLDWLARIDEVQLNSSSLCPDRHNLTRELRTVVHDQHLW